MNGALQDFSRWRRHVSHHADLRHGAHHIGMTALIIAAIGAMSGPGSLPAALPNTLVLILAGLIFTIGGKARNGYLSRNVALLACAFAGIGVLVYSSRNSANAPSFELAAQLLTAITLLIITAASWQTRISHRTCNLILVSLLGTTALLHWLIASHATQVAQLLTSVRLLVLALDLAAVIILTLRLRHAQPFAVGTLLAAVILTSISDLTSLPDGSHADWLLLISQLCRLASFLLLLRIAFIEHVEKPYRELDLTQSRLAATLDAVPDLILEIDAFGRCHYQHGAASDNEQPILQQGLGRTVCEGLPAAAVAVVARVISEVLACGRTSGHELSLDLPGGTRWFALSAATKACLPGEEARIIVQWKDITRRYQSEQQLYLLEKAVASLKDILLITDAGPDPRIVFVNDAFERLTGYQRSEVIGQSPRMLQGPKTCRTELDRINAAIANWQPVRAELINYTRHGDEFQIELDITPIADARGGFTHWAAVERDVTARKVREQQLADDARHAQSILDNVVDAVITIDQVGCITTFNLAATNLFGYRPDEIIGQNVRVLMPQPYRHEHDGYLQNYEQSGIKRIIGIGREVQGEHKLGGTFPIHLAVSKIERDGKPMFIGLVRDITQRHQAEARIEQLAFYDPLTELPNRRLLLDRMGHTLAASARSQELGALIFIDLDDFKRLNDSWGHETGDQMLVQVARRLLQCVREGDTVARLGGDEFIVMLENLGKERQVAAAAAETVAEKIQAKFADPFSFDGRNHQGTCSLGITLFGDSALSANEVIDRADSAMYQAKSEGRNTTRFFDAALQAALATRAALEEDLSLSLLRHELHLNYQPQVNLQGELLGAEALVRWTHPVRGSVPPARFIPIAEHTGFILELGLWVLQTACLKLANWRLNPATAALTMSVNVSARQFRHPQFVEQVLATLAWAGADPARLKLELTESMLVDNIEELVAKMAVLKKHGVNFSLDDFGTGYSSLSYLKRLPLDQLKIDQSFVRDVLVDAHDAAIARTIVALGQSMGLAVIAEGVETTGQRDFLAQNGCYLFQGYLYSQPLAPDLFDHYVLQAISATTTNKNIA
jgi:diguanylate cyclase (GGDEF)-like protein/PAS domain S-box-containing protein